MIWVNALQETFLPLIKRQVHEDIEENLLFNWIDTLPSYYAEEMKALYNEMTERKTVEAKIYKAIDSLEA